MAASLCPKMGECEKGPADSYTSGVILIVNKIRGLGQCRTKPVFQPVLPDGSGAFVFLASPRPARSRMAVFPKVSFGKFSLKNSASAWISRGKTKKGLRCAPARTAAMYLDYMPGFPLSGPRFHSFFASKKGPVHSSPKLLIIIRRPDRRKSVRLSSVSRFFRTFFRFFLYFHPFTI